MKAMVLAAGLGTRLGSLTADRPKALVEVSGRTLLEIVLARLRSFEIHDVIINVHHFADQIADYLIAHNNFGMNIAISRENILLDTGGGLKNAAWFFLQSATAEPFLLHNVDIVSSIDLNAMFAHHIADKALATLAVQHRETSRLLLFNDQFELCGRRLRGQPEQLVRPAPNLQPLAFTGIHIISSALLPLISEAGVFSIIDVYLRLAAAGQKISGFPADQFYWRDLGRPADLTAAAHDLAQNLFQ